MLLNIYNSKEKRDKLLSTVQFGGHRGCSEDDFIPVNFESLIGPRAKDKAMTPGTT